MAYLLVPNPSDGETLAVGREIVPARESWE